MGKKTGIAICAALLAGLLGTAVLYTQNTSEEPIENAGTAVNAVQAPKVLTYMGDEYPIRKHLQSVLLIGTDSLEKYEEKSSGLKPFYNYNQADFLLLLVLDNDAKTVEAIHLNRDTITDVPWLDVLGEYGGTEKEQLCLAFNSGSGGKDSCRNTVDAVSRLLFDVPIDGYIQIPMTAIPVLNDLVGGVPVTITDDLTPVDPAFVQGATLRLTGTQAEKFVRARKTLVDDTNLSRMRRQRDYIDSFQKCAKDALNTDSNFVMKLLDKLSTYLQSEMTAQQLSDLIQRLDTYKISPVRWADGDLIVGEDYYEFYMDEGAMWENVKYAYCE